MRRFLEGILMILSIVLLSISIYFLMGMFAQEKHDRDVYEKVIEIYENAEEQTGEDEDRESEEEKGDEQFEIDDSRSLDVMYRDIAEEGLQPVLNDYVYV